MRDNGPVTNTERHFGEHERIISKTDLKGRIVYANRSFIDISGFTMDELRGKAHNMVRHPEMPEAAFEDLWSTLKAGKSWRGMVKNRCKNGDYYWVEANVSPVLEGGSITGYVSLRTRPTREQVDAAENIYRLMREGRANHLRISEGRILRRGPMRIIDAFKAAGIQAWLFLWTGALLSFMAGLLVMGVAPWIFVLNNLIFLAGMTLHLRALIVRPLKEALRMSQRLAAGDLEYRADFEARGEFSELLHSLNVMQGTLHTMVSDVSAKAKSVGDASTGIANGITSLSQRTEAQASSLEETASSMEELTSTVRENADNAVQASRLMEETRSSAQAGGEVVTRAVEAMSEIDAASKRIAEISTVIDEIAFQTNLLALNAAVEAARAGEQGRGFAVVAGEVRNLAQRSAASAREIKDLIQDTVSKVENGRRLVNESGQTLTQIVSSVSKVNNVISDIAGASREQAAGIDQVNNAVMQMDQITQHNARLVDDAARASQLVADESEALVDVAAFFRRGGEADHRVAPQPKPKSAAATGHAAAGAGPRVRSAAGGSRRRVA